MVRLNPRQRRRLLIMLWAMGLGVSPSPVSAQTVDWGAAGGDLFGRETPLEPEEAADTVRVPALSQPMLAEIERAAQAYGLDPKLLHALVLQESGYRTNAVSTAGAVGLTQLMPATALELGVRDRTDPIDNLRGGADYLARQIVRFENLELALAAYNAGPSRVARLGRVPDIAETRQYVAGVLACYLALAAGRRIRSAAECPRAATS